MTDGHRTWAYRTWLSLTVAMIGTVMLVMAIVMIGHNRAAPVDAGALSATATSADTSSTHFNTYSTSPAAPEATTETPHRGPLIFACPCDP